MQAVLAGPGYEAALREACVPLRVHVVDSDHWSIVSSAPVYNGAKPR